MQRAKIPLRIGLLFWLTLSLWTTSLRAQTNQLPQPELITDRQGLPQGFVSGIVQDQQGFIWMATHDGLCRYDGSQFKVFRASPRQPSPLTFSNIAALKLDHQGRIWVMSEQDELVVFNPRTELFTNISNQWRSHLPFARAHIRQFYPDRQNRLWLALYSEGLVCYDLSTQRFRWFRHRADKPHSLSSDSTTCVLQDQQGTIWVGTANAGLDRFNEQATRFDHYRPNSPTPLALPELYVLALHQQPSGELLLGTAQHLCQFNPKTGQFQAYRLPAEINSLGGNRVLWGMHFATDSRGMVYVDRRVDRQDWLFQFSRQQGLRLLAHFTPQTGLCASLLIDQSDVLWMGADGLGVRKYDLRADGFQTARYQAGFQTDLFTQWLHVPEAQVVPTRSNNPYMFRYTLDHQGFIWANVGSSVFYRVNPATHQAQRVDFPIRFASAISPLAADPQGHVWVVHENELWAFDWGRQQWVRSTHRVDYSRTGEIMQLVADSAAFWFITRTNGLFRLDRQMGQLRQYLNLSSPSASLNSTALLCLSADPDDVNRLWIGSSGAGLSLFDKRSGRCRWITEEDGLPNNVIYSAIPDGHGYLWIGTNKGLCRLNRKTLQTRTYTTEDGLLANEFNRFHYVQQPTGQLIMGGVEGITAFQPAQLRVDSFQPRVELTELFINNKLARADSSSFLRAPIQAVDRLNLPYTKNFLTVQFAALQFNRLGKNRYRYRLEGVDPDWVETSQPQAIYTALAPDHYTLLVNASNTSGAWSPHIRQLDIIISPPFWNTWWAYVLYVLAVASSIWYGIQLRLNQLQLQRSVALRQQEARQLRELDEMKSRFFTNVTHDFRTPLTLILSPLAGLIQEQAGTRFVKRLELINRNAQQLLNLINQLLDFSKLEAGALSIQEARGNIGQFIEQSLYLYREEAVRKTITFTYQQEDLGEYWFDADKLERILSNLMGNALKFTPAGGQITVTLQESDGITLTVSDTGVGIAEDKLPFIFDRFFQGSRSGVPANAGSDHPADATETGLSAETVTPQTGTGIGLSLVKELVERQQGQINVESELGKGTTFQLKLPYRKADGVMASTGAITPSATTTQTDASVEPKGEQAHLLLIEDNPELAEFIADSLPAQYRVSRASNGVEGLQQALADLPDLIISDVMMPLMDGYTLCKKLKEDERTNHIPVILLTAKVTLDNRLEGLERGADDYLTKPFHVAELNLRIHNLLERQHRLRERVRQELLQPMVEGTLQPEPAAPAPPNPFLEKLYTIIDSRLDDTSFSVENLADQLAMSRVHLHRKLKALTGLAASDLIRNYRLKRATQLLQQGFNSAETAYQTGFDSPQYFAKCFREVYHMTPTEFAQKSQKTA